MSAAPSTSVNELLFGFKGRVGRLQYWLIHVAAAVAIGLFWAVVNVRAPGDETGGGPAAEFLKAIPAIVAILSLWPLIAVSVKRLHDRGRSGWWLLLALVPGLGQLWQVIDLGVLPGAADESRFGPPPSAGQATRDVRSVTVMFFLGFSAGLPNLLVFDTLSAWLRDAGLSLGVIGFFSLATLSYSFKFLWAPLIDRTHVPLLTKWLGHRRSWMLVCQALIMAGLVMIAGVDPTKDLGLMALFAVFVGFSSATQDIVIDAWRIEATEQDTQGAMAAAYQWGYRLAVVVAGAAPLLLATVFDWNFSYGIMAALMLIGALAVFAAPREKQHVIRPIHAEGVAANRGLEGLEWVGRLTLFGVAAVVLGSGLSGDPALLTGILSGLGQTGAADALKAAWTGKAFGVFLQFAGVIAGFAIIVLAIRPLPGARTRPGVYLSAALGDPLRDFFQRYGKVAGLILALICLYRVSDFVLNIMNPFYLDLGFTKPEIAEVRKVFGVVMSMLGVFCGGLAVARLGLLNALVLGAFAGPLSNLVFAWLTTQGHDVGALMIAIGVDNVATGIAGTCLIAYMSSLTGEGFTATQYALFSSLYALPGKLIASQSGRIVEGTAHSADAGGAAAGLKGLFVNLPPETLAEGAAKTMVTPAALGAGYFVFFLYSTVIGVFAVILSFMVAHRSRRLAKADATAPST